MDWGVVGANMWQWKQQRLRDEKRETATGAAFVELGGERSVKERR